MTGLPHPAAAAIVDGATNRVSKEAVRALFKRTLYDFRTPENFRTHDMNDVEAAFISGGFFSYDPDDTTTADDGVTCVHDSEGRRFKSSGESAALATLLLHEADTTNPHSVTKAQVGLGNADNTSDASKPVSTATQTALDAKAPLISPGFSGTPTAPTAAAGTNTTQLATTAFVKKAVDDLVAAAPGALDTLDELSAALADDPNFATTMTNALAGKENSGAAASAVSAHVSAPDPHSQYLTETDAAATYATAAALSLHAGSTSNPHSVTKAQVGLGNVDNTADADKPVSTAAATALATKAPLISPNLTGTPTAPTAAAGTNTTQLATTAFVKKAVDDLVAAAPGALDTLDELSAALADDPNFATTMTNALAGKEASGTAASAIAAHVAASDPHGQYLTESDAVATYATTANLSAHAGSTSNPHYVTKAQVGLGNVDNTSDAAKPISSATQTALNAKQDALVSGTNVKTINGQDITGSGNLVIGGGAGSGDMSMSTYDTDSDGVVDAAETAPWSGITGKPSTYPPDTHSHAISDVPGLQTALDSKSDASHSHSNATTSAGGFMSASDKTKLDGLGSSASSVSVTSASGSFGYGTGAGATVTQSTTKSTSVTINAPTGKITTTGDYLGANAVVAFTVNNNTVKSSDVVVLSFGSSPAGQETNYTIWASVNNGSFKIAIKNISAVGRTEAITINFAVIQGATA
ncbi:MAG TPA: hypothetical protein PKE19_00195 [Aestuariivirga sp.]|nr:hypothetical protein [Aestuariivirga sp.]